MSAKGQESTGRTDLTGKVFGRWTVLGYSHFTRGMTYWSCRCECGTEKKVYGKSLLSGRSTSCGCLRKPNLLGKRFGRWLVLKDAGFKPSACGKYNHHYWLCRCDCGTEKEANQGGLLHGHSNSCGCYARDLLFERNTKEKLPSGVAAFNALLGRYRWHAENRGFEFSLSKEKVLELTQSNCKYCDLKPLQCYKINSGEKYIYNGIDRVNNTLGYTDENSVPCCKVCNLAKRTLTLEQFTAWIARLVKVYKLKETVTTQSEEIQCLST